MLKYTSENMSGANKKTKAGFSLVESVIAIAIFTILAGVIYQTSALLIKTVGIYRENTAISSLANQYMEIVHNLPYSAVGTLSGNPHGNLPDLPNAPQTTINDTTYQIYYVVNYIDNPADGTALEENDFASNDYKQVKLYVKNTRTDKTHSFVTNITPRGLENLDSGGALSIKVIDAVGQPVPNATINILNDTLNPNINLSRMTNVTGDWIEVALSTSTSSYNLTATKSGYSTDQTYPITVANPNPSKPDATIADGQVTNISLSIDKLSDLSFKTLDQNCSVLPNIGMRIHGQKLIGSPDLYKFDDNYFSNSAGEISLDSIEWDTYLPIPTDNYMIYGSSPAPSFKVLPDTNQNFNLILGPETTNGLLVVVKEAGSKNPIEGATVQLENPMLNVDESKITGGSVWSSDNWTGGGGQADWSDPTKYSGDNGHIGADASPSALHLFTSDGTTYDTEGSLTSSTFDTGATTTVFTTINWQPTSQNASTSIEFQIATSNENTATTTWNFVGPDETSGSYFTSSGTNINAGARYIRYRVFLNTDDETVTPVLSSVSINYISGCFTPGQVFFSGLQSDTDKNYEITVSAPDYITQTIDSQELSGYQTLEVLLSH